MSHTSVCEDAKGYTCACPCGGARHGGVLIHGISSTDHSDRSLARTWAAPHRWTRLDDAPKESTHSDASAPRRKAMTGVITELVTTLIDQLEETGQVAAVQTLATRISDDVGDVIEDHLSSEGPDQRGKNHLWCVVVAAICRAYDETVDGAGRSLEKLSQTVVELLQAPPKSDRTEYPTVTAIDAHRHRVRRAFEFNEYAWLETLISKALKAILAAITTLGEETTLKYVRLIGTIVCPDPDRHPAIIKHCLWPLIQGPFRDALREGVADEIHNWLKNAYLVKPA